MQSIREIVLTEISDLLKHENKDVDLSQFTDNSILLETGIDSLGFAIIVTRLELILGYDPFTLDPSPMYPKTLVEFVSFYEKYSEMRQEN
jgi:hypothetical protein